MTDDLHIASLVVQHRPTACAALEAMVASTPGLEIALQGGIQSVLLQESVDTAGLMASIDRLRDLPGVLNVNLVYHHVEPRAMLDRPIASASAQGEPA